MFSYDALYLLDVCHLIPTGKKLPENNPLKTVFKHIHVVLSRASLPVLTIHFKFGVYFLTIVGNYLDVNSSTSVTLLLLK